MDNLVFSNMLHRPARTAVSIIGIAVGVLLIVFTVGLANGSMRERAAREANVGAEIFFKSSGSIGLAGTEALNLPIDLKQKIESVEGVQTALAVAQNTVSTDDNNTGSRLIDGIVFDDYAKIVGMNIVEGRKFGETADEVVIDTGFQRQKDYKIGDKIKLYERDFTIVGTYEPAAGARVKMPLSVMQNQLGANGKVSAFLVKIKKGYEEATAATNLQNNFPDNQIIPVSQLEELYMQAIPAMGVFLNVVIGVAAVISALVILLTMFTTVTERTRQIGVMKSLGMSNTAIGWIITQEALLITFCGIVVGILLTIITRLILRKFTTLEVEISFVTIALTLIIGLLGGVLGALYPALKAARMDAVEALSYE